MVVSTCNRVELYAVSRDGHDAAPALLRLLARRAGVPVREVLRSATVRRSGAAVRHLFEVAAGLDSLVPGDGTVAALEIVARHADAFWDRRGRADAAPRRVVA